MASGCSDVVIRHDRADIFEDPVLDGISDLPAFRLQLDPLHKTLVVHLLVERREEYPFLSAQLLILSHHRQLPMLHSPPLFFHFCRDRPRRVNLRRR